MDFLPEKNRKIIQYTKFLNIDKYVLLNLYFFKFLHKNIVMNGTYILLFSSQFSQLFRCVKIGNSEKIVKMALGENYPINTI